MSVFWSPLFTRIAILEKNKSTNMQQQFKIPNNPLFLILYSPFSKSFLNSVTETVRDDSGLAALRLPLFSQYGYSCLSGDVRRTLAVWLEERAAWMECVFVLVWKRPTHYDSRQGVGKSPPHWDLFRPSSQIRTHENTNTHAHTLLCSVPTLVYMSTGIKRKVVLL